MNWSSRVFFFVFISFAVYIFTVGDGAKWKQLLTTRLAAPSPTPSPTTANAGVSAGSTAGSLINPTAGQFAGMLGGADTGATAGTVTTASQFANLGALAG